MPNAPGHWKPALRKRDALELMAWREELEEILTRPVIREIRSLMGQSRDVLLRQLSEGPVVDQAVYAKQAGVTAGLAAFEGLVADIQSAARQAEDQRRAELEGPRSRPEVFR